MAKTTWKVDLADGEHYVISDINRGFINWSMRVEVDGTTVIDKRSLTVFGLRGQHLINIGQINGTLRVGGIWSQVDLFVDGKKLKKETRGFLRAK